jgi:hypothetical protein
LFNEQSDSGVKLFDNKPFNSASASLNYHLTDSHKMALRQEISVHGSGDNNSRWKGATRGYYDINYDGVDFGSSKLRPFVGVNAAYLYGSPVNKSILAGTEAGVKIHVQPKTLVTVQTEYQSIYHDGDQLQATLNKGSMIYSLGINFRF